MYKEYPAFKCPKDSTIIWRYIDFLKFFAMIDRSILFFPSALTLAEEDPYEGSFARGNIVNGKKNGIELKEKMDVCRRGVYISSWYISRYESVAMWKCFADNEDGIAIQSTVKRLKKSFDQNPKDIHIAEIQYIDYEKSSISEEDIFLNFIHKRKSFRHEKELRALFWDKNVLNENAELPKGVAVPIKPHVLIEKIYISPTAPKWKRDLVASVLEKYGLEKEVLKSNLNSNVLW